LEVGKEEKKVIGSEKDVTRYAKGATGRKDEQQGRAKGARAENGMARSCPSLRGDRAKSLERFLDYLMVAWSCQGARAGCAKFGF